MSTIKEIREKSGLSIDRFSEEYNFPADILKDWETGKKKCPEYIETLLDRAVTEGRKTFEIYSTNEILKELGCCYKSLLNILNGRKRASAPGQYKWTESHDPYPGSDIFPTKYFTIIVERAMTIGVPNELNQRIANLMTFIDPDDWRKSMETPCPLETRVYFLMGTSLVYY